MTSCSNHVKSLSQETSFPSGWDLSFSKQEISREISISLDRFQWCDSKIKKPKCLLRIYSFLPVWLRYKYTFASFGEQIFQILIYNIIISSCFQEQLNISHMKEEGNEKDGCFHCSAEIRLPSVSSPWSYFHLKNMSSSV